MKRLFILLYVAVLLTGCVSEDGKMDRVVSLRSQLGKGTSVFQAIVTADYGETLHKFTLDCRYEPTGKLYFTVVEPESIEGISGKISGSGRGELTFDEAVLAFELMADGLLSPVSAPWIIFKALHGGYITACGSENDLIRATIRDSYADNAMTTDIWITKENIPVRGEILWDNRRILTIEIKNFTVM